MLSPMTLHFPSTAGKCQESALVAFGGEDGGQWRETLAQSLAFLLKTREQTRKLA